METQLKLQLSALATPVELSGLEQWCEMLAKQVTYSLSFAPWTKQLWTAELNEHYLETKFMYAHYSLFLTPTEIFKSQFLPLTNTTLLQGD